jgi:hypothetical protein
VAKKNEIIIEFDYIELHFMLYSIDALQSLVIWRNNVISTLILYCFVKIIRL